MDRYAMDIFADLARKSLAEELKNAGERGIDADVARKCLEYGLNFYSALVTPKYVKDSERNATKDIWTDVFRAHELEIRNLSTLITLNRMIRSK